MFTDTTLLSTRSDQLTLPGRSDPPRFRQVLAAEANQHTWRLVELFTVGGGPFEAELSWSSGCGVGARALVSIAQAARVGIYARTLKVRARNLTADDNPVGVTVADGRAVTHNQWETRGEVGPSAPVVIPVPPFARSVRLDVADPLATPEMLLVDGDDVLRGRIPFDQQPDDGVLVGATRDVQLTAAADTFFRLVFALCL